MIGSSASSVNPTYTLARVAEVSPSSSITAGDSAWRWSSVQSKRSPARVVARLDKLREQLGDIFDGTIDLNKATQAHAKKWRRVIKKGIPRATKVRFENDLSIDHTIIDVFAPDRPGLLYRITRALSSQNLVIFRANISTEADIAIDSFYVAGPDGGKVTSPTQLQRVRRALERAIE